MLILKWILFLLIGFFIAGDYTLVTRTKDDIRITRRFNGLIWCWLLREKMFWKKVEDLKPNSRNNITEEI